MKLITILKSYWSKILSVFLFIILLGAYTNIFAIGSPYSPGSTLNPECAPGSINCYVDPNLSNPWLTGTSGIYHNGNVNVGSGTSSVDASIGSGSDISLVFESLVSNDSLDNYISITTNNDGNPVIAYYTSPELMEYNFINSAIASGYESSLNIVTCLDPECGDLVESVIDSNFYIDSGLKPFVKIGTDNIARIAYMVDINNGTPSLRYAVCSNEECSISEISTIITDIGLHYAYSLSLDENNNPYFLYNYYDSVSGYNVVSIARYTGDSGNDCGEDSSWVCIIVTPTDYNYYLSNENDSNGDLVYIDETDDLPRFVADRYDDNSGFNVISYFECLDVNCDTYNQEDVDIMKGYVFNYALNKDTEGNPIIIYNSNPDPNNNPYNNNIMMAKYVGGGSGDNCVSEDWNCSSILGADVDFSNMTIIIPFAISFDVGSDNNLRISLTKTYLEQNGEGMNMTKSGGYLKCLNNSCSFFSEDYLYTLSSDSYDSTPFVSITLNSSDEMYLTYFDPIDGAMKAFKETISSGLVFNKDNNNSFYTAGDLGISGHLFVDGSIASLGGLYLNDGVPDNTVGALYNVGGELYWNGGLLSLGSNNSSSNSPILIMNNSNLFSVELDGFDNYNEYIEGITNSIFLGSYAGYNRANTDNNNFFGYQAGALANFYGDGEGGNNFLGYQAGYDSMFVDNSNFLGYQAGYNGSSISNFFGYQAGYEANGSHGSNFFGFQAGYESNGSYSSNFIGQLAGYNAYSSSDSNFIGREAGFNSNNIYHSNFLGYQAGYSVTDAQYSNFLGSESGYSATYANSSNFLGSGSGYSATYANGSNFLGINSGSGATNASDSNFFGRQAGYSASNARNSIFIGQNAGYNDTVNNTSNANDFSILIGKSTSTGGFKNSIAIGGSAINTAQNQFMIGSTTRPINTTVWKGTSVTATLDTATGLITTSDERLKTNIHILNTNEDYMDYASSTRESYTEDEISEMTILDKVLKITPVRYDWREDPDNEYIFEQDITPENIGFIAQDLINFFPEVVYIGHDENKYLGVNYANMTPILVEAIKELNLKVEAISLDNDSNIFSSVIKKVENGIAYLTNLVVDTIEIGSSDKPTGIILYSKSGDRYCLFVNEEGNSVTETMQEGDECPKIEAPSDVDEDGVVDEIDNCLSIPNSLQEDEDDNGVGDACEMKEIDQDNPPVDPKEPEVSTV